MSTAATVPTTIDPEAAALVAEQGLQAALEQMLDRARQTIPGLHRLDVRFAPGYDTGWDGVIIDAFCDPALEPAYGETVDRYRRWTLETFAADVWRFITLNILYWDGHAG